MARYQKFEELPVWQDASRLYHAVLDVLEEPQCRLSAGFRNQLDRAALSVSNNVAEGFERVSTAELLGFLAIARGSAGEVRSMMAVISSRPKLQPLAGHFASIRTLAESCAKQLTAWIQSVEEGRIEGKRHLTPEVKQQRLVADKMRAFRLNFLRELKPDHPLYNSEEARAAREGAGTG